MTARRIRPKGTPETDPESHLPRYEISWWELNPQDKLPVYRVEVFEEVGKARSYYKSLPKEAEPMAARVEWIESTRLWRHVDMISEARTPEQARAAAPAGIAMVRSVLAHKRGRDTRAELAAALAGAPMPSLDGNVEKTRGHDHRNGAAGCPVCARSVAEESPAECVVCDYLCGHGREPLHPFAQLTQPTLDVDERF
jgi:hypothetical protein